MNHTPSVGVAGLKLHVTFIMALLLTGCASTPKVDWEARIGAYTSDEAILELGPPDTSAILADGTQVAEWIETSKGPRMTVGFGLGTGSYGGGYGTATGAGVSTPVGPRQTARRLTFDRDGVLQAVQVIR